MKKIELNETYVFKYGQWTVEITPKMGFDDYICSIFVTGNWRSTPGIMYDYWRDCCAYDEPELLPRGLKDRIYKKSKQILGHLVFE